MAYPWEKNDPLVSPVWEANDPLVSPEVNPWEANDPVVDAQTEDTQENLFSRFGKQLYNTAVAAPVQAIGTEAEVGKLSTNINTLSALADDVQERFETGQPLTQKEVNWYSERPGWGRALKSRYESGMVDVRPEFTTEERLERLNQAATIGKQQTVQQADVSATVKEASNWLEGGVDVVAGITGFIAQLTALKKAFPSLSQPAIWELQNQIEGGTLGFGALQYAAFHGPAKLIPGKGRAAEIGKTALASGAFASVNAIEQMIDEGEIDPVSVLIAAGIPIGLKVAGGAAGRLKRFIKAKNPKVMKALGEKYPETLSPQPDFTVTQGGRTLAVDTRGINVQKAAWDNKWGGRNTAKLRTQMQGLLDKVKGEKNVSKLTALADDMEKLDIELERIAPKNLHKASIKKLHSLARKHRIDVPKGTTKTGLKRLLAGQQDVVETESGYAVRNLLSKGKAGTAWEIDRYATRAEAIEVFHNQQVAMSEALGRGTGQLTGKPRIRVMAEIGRTTDAPITTLNVTGPGATSIEESTKKLVTWSKKAKPLNKTEVKAAVKANVKRQAAAGTTAIRRAIVGKESAFKSLVRGMSAMRGKANTPKVNPPDLSNAQWEGVYRKIIDVFPTETKATQFKRSVSFRAVTKLRNGDIPTDYEFGFLDKLLGREATLSLHKSLVAKRGYSIWDIPRLTRDGLKTMFAYDPQAVRQTSGIAVRHPDITRRAIKANVEAYVGPKLLRRAGRKALLRSTAEFETAVKAAERINKRIEATPGYDLSTKYVNYLGVTPWASAKAGTRLQQYGGFAEFLLSRKGNSIAAKTARKWGQVINASERGANAGINTAVNLLWAEGEKDLARQMARKSMTAAQIKNFRVNRGRDIMTGIKRRTALTPQGKEIERAANWVLFSPTNTWSRLIQPLQVIKRAIRGEGLEGKSYAAQLMVSNIAKISAMGSIAAYTGHRLRANDPTQEPYIDGSNDPTNSMWGKTRVGNDVLDPTGGDASTYRMFARVGLSAYMYGRELITGKEGSSPEAGEEFRRWLGSRETVLLGLGKTLATGKDWLGRPIGRVDALLKSFPIEFVVSVVEAGTADGVWEQMAAGDIQEASIGFVSNLPVGAFGLLGGGTGSYPVRAATARYNFKNFIAEKEHNKEWDDLTIGEQRRLTRENRRQFEVLDRQVKVERIADPYDPKRQIEEARLSQKKITGLLSKPNQAKVAGFSVAVSRRPKNFYLNDERYQKYQELTAKYLNERLTKRNLESRSERTQIILLELDVTLAKDKAFREIRREMR